MLPVDPHLVVQKLRSFQAAVQCELIRSRTMHGLHEAKRVTSADTIYQIDALVDPLLEAFCQEWGQTTSLVVIAEGLEDETGREGARTFPRGTCEEDALIRLIVDPIDGTRGLMYDKRSAWALAGVAPNKGRGTRLRDIEVAVMTELPTSKAGFADVLWAIKGQGAHGERIRLDSAATSADALPLRLQPSQATDLHHGVAMISNFFPGTKVLAAGLMEAIAREFIGEADVSTAPIFDDQYISTGGQFFEMVVGHDRFNADLRPMLYKAQGQPERLCCHPYDCATLLIAEEAGVIITDGLGNLLDGPFDTTTGLSWAAYANVELQRKIEPVLTRLLREMGR